MPFLSPSRSVSRRAAFTLVVTAVACGPTPEAIEPRAADSCIIVPDGAVDTVTVAVGDPWSHGLGETLIELQCDGTLRPGAAVRWRQTSEPGVWRVTLRATRTFWDGTPLTAVAVREGWMLGEASRPRPWPKGSSVEEAVRVVDDSTLEVALASRSNSAVRVFADPAFAVMKAPTDTFPWPRSTGPYAIRHPVSHPERVVAAPVITVVGDALPVIRYVPPEADQRDDLDRRVGLLRTRDHTVVEYARQLGVYRAIQLPWDRVYVAVVPHGSADGLELHVDLASALGTAAQPAEGTYWWESSESCPSEQLEPAAVVQRPENAIAYSEDDPVAQTLAERLVALARSGALGHVGFTADDPPTARVLARPTLRQALAAGRFRAYVLRREIRVYDACVEARALARAMPWVTGGDLPRVMVPLVETHGWALVADRVGPVALDWRGTPYFPFMRGSRR